MEELTKELNLPKSEIIKIINEERAISYEEYKNLIRIIKKHDDSLININFIKEKSFVDILKERGFNNEEVEDIQKIELLINSLFTQEQINKLR